jgi:hypothetical protein
MLEESNQVLILLIVINIGLCSYYYLLRKDKLEKQNEDKYFLYLDEKFSNTTNKVIDSKSEYIPKQATIENKFHDSFFENNKYLGWRQFYLKNQSNQNVEKDGNFDGIITRNFLDNISNVKNEVTPLKYRIR